MVRQIDLIRDGNFFCQDCQADFDTPEGGFCCPVCGAERISEGPIKMRWDDDDDE